MSIGEFGVLVWGGVVAWCLHKLMVLLSQYFQSASDSSSHENTRLFGESIETSFSCVCLLLSLVSGQVLSRFILGSCLHPVCISCDF